ncbi:type II toxin-antitoxin system VapC family toxin [Rubrobacter aplysinae]|uniref:type II toxin-antitoxin system VapC family toxin n=1 Tax=Rubrobacter aplysinae TaxID=909625 RepID=UPI00069F0EC8|nr:type II toxin-antitoxin system VapC family toxin [Rubrobacter aplysinae]
MILYLDTSALIKLYAEEPETGEVRYAVEEARLAAVSEIGYVEARSALARREREGSFSKEEHDEALEHLEHDFRELYLLRRVSGEIIVQAGEMVRSHALRAYDAVHLATALELREEARELYRRQQQPPEELQVWLTSYDSALYKAARREGITREETN